MLWWFGDSTSVVGDDVGRVQGELTVTLERNTNDMKKGVAKSRRAAQKNTCCCSAGSFAAGPRVLSYGEEFK